jgi:hypothetical protein
MSKAIVIQTNGTCQLVEHQGLAWLQQTVGGWVEMVTLPDPVNAGMYVHEEGNIIGLPYNSKATFLAHESRRIPLDQGIVGPVVLVGPPDSHGEDTDVPDHLIQTLIDSRTHVHLDEAGRCRVCGERVEAVDPRGEAVWP